MNTVPTLAALTLAATAGPAAELDFYRDIYPFLKANCISCHNKTTTKADLNMESPELMKKGGESGPGIVPGRAAESLIVQASMHQHDMEMPPPKNKSGAVDLTASELSLLKQWIDQGAKSSVEQEREVAWRPLAPGVHPIYSVAMTRDGRFAACGRSNRIFVYDLATRQMVMEITDANEKSVTAHRALVQSLAFSPDGTRLASGSFREVKIWRLEPGGTEASAVSPAGVPVNEALVRRIAEAAKVEVASQAQSADGRRVVTGCADGSVRVWDAATAKPITELRGSVAAGRKMAELDWTIAAQGLELAFRKTEFARIEAQNKALDELLKKANEAIAAMKKVLPEKLKAVQPARDAKAAAEKAVEEVVASIAKAPDGKADAALDKQLKDAREKLLTSAMAETSALSAVSAAENNIKDAEADVKRITGAKARNKKELSAAHAAIETAKKKEDQAAAELAAARQALTKPGARPLAVAFSADGQRVAAMFNDGMINVWAVATGTAIEQVTGSATTAATLAGNADGGFTASSADGKTLGTSAPSRWVLERTLGDASSHAIFADRVNAVRFSPDGKTLATGGGEPSRSGDVHLFDVMTGKVIKSWKERHGDAVLSLDFSPNGRLIASGGSDKIARVTDIATGRQVNLFEGHTHHVMGVAFRADGRVLATAGADNVVISWDMVAGERKKKIEGWTKEVTSLQFIGATNQIVTSAGDNLVRIVSDEGAEIRAISQLPDFMQSAASAPGGGTIIGGGEDSILRVWDGANGKEVAAFGMK